MTRADAEAVIAALRSARENAIYRRCDFAAYWDERASRVLVARLEDARVPSDVILEAFDADGKTDRDREASVRVETAGKR